MKTLIAAVLLGIILQGGTAAATIYLYVSPTGDDSGFCTPSTNPCQTIGAAVTMASTSQDTIIRVARGDYVEHITINQLSQPLVIEGGWNSDYTEQSHDPALTRLTSDNNNAVFNISAPVWGTLSLRLSYLGFRGTTDGQRIGVSASADQTTLLNLTIEQCLFTAYRGQAIDLSVTGSSEATFNLDQNTIRGNFQFPESEAWSGAGVSVIVFNGSTATVTFTKNKVLDNQARSGGGISLYARDSTLNAKLENNIIAGNIARIQAAAGNGGGLYGVAGGTATMGLTLANNTVVENEAVRGRGNNMFLVTVDSATLNTYLKNTIAWGEGTDISMERYSSSSLLSLTADYSLIGEVDTTGGSTYTDKSSNLHVDPLLKTDYHLSSASPAKDAGICGQKVLGYSRIAPYDDIDGDPRPGFGTLLGCDIGADEYSFSWLLFNSAFMKK